MTRNKTPNRIKTINGKGVVLCTCEPGRIDTPLLVKTGDNAWSRPELLNAHHRWHPQIIDFRCEKVAESFPPSRMNISRFLAMCLVIDEFGLCEEDYSFPSVEERTAWRITGKCPRCKMFFDLLSALSANELENCSDFVDQDIIIKAKNGNPRVYTCSLMITMRGQRQANSATIKIDWIPSPNGNQQLTLKGAGTRAFAKEAQEAVLFGLPASHFPGWADADADEHFYLWLFVLREALHKHKQNMFSHVDPESQEDARNSFRTARALALSKEYKIRAEGGTTKPS